LFEVILPKDNEKDVAEVPENLRKAMKLHFVETMDQVLQIALESPLPTIEEEGTQPIAPPLTSGAGDSPAAHQ
jgi:ATP-dependent Lon protease